VKNLAKGVGIGLIFGEWALIVFGGGMRVVLRWAVWVILGWGVWVALGGWVGSVSDMGLEPVFGGSMGVVTCISLLVRTRRRRWRRRWWR